jgi:N-acetylglucosaminyldiphosphoundecaprenol N-acetyl-beta-D-mannosaminyltransferase
VTMAPPDSRVGQRYRGLKRDYLGIGLSCLPDTEVLRSIEEAVDARSRLVISFLNPDYALRALRSPDLKAKMNSFDVMLADGWGVVFGGRLLGLPVPDRQGNDDIGPLIFEMCAKKGYSQFLFGSAPGIADKAASTLREAYPELPIAGTLHGYWDVERGHSGRYDDVDQDMMVERINAARPDVLWVGVPTPLQQDWVVRNAHRITAPVIITGGSYIDHLSENVHWFPAWMLKLRLGWLYRLYREPRRLWRRYTVELGQYWLIVLGYRLRRRTA